MNQKNLLCLCVLATVAACAQPQKPVQFGIVADPVNSLAEVRAALAERGIETETIDEQAGIVHSMWVDTGFMYGEVQHVTATIIRRYTVIVKPQGTGSTLTVRADVKRCAQDGFQIDHMMVTGACEAMPGLVPAHQQELDQLGVALRSRLN